MVRKAYLEAETVVEGQTSNFYCDVTSPSQPVINWIKDLQPDKASGPLDNDVVISYFCLRINLADAKSNPSYSSNLYLSVIKNRPDTGPLICSIVIRYYVYNEQHTRAGRNTQPSTKYSTQELVQYINHTVANASLNQSLKLNIS